MEKKEVSESASMLLEDKIASLEENVSVLNAEITVWRSFSIEQLLVMKKTTEETSSVDSSLSESNKLRDDITHLR